MYDKKKAQGVIVTLLLNKGRAQSILCFNRRRKSPEGSGGWGEGGGGVIKTCEYWQEHCSEKLKITSTGPVYRSGLLNIYTSQATCTFCRQPDTAHVHTIYGHEGRTVNVLSLPLSVSIKSYGERCFSSSLTGSCNVSEITQHVSLIQHALHWLPICQRIYY